MERQVLANLEVVKQYLEDSTYPKNYNKDAKRTVRVRSKAFLLDDGQLFYTAGRPRQFAEDGTKETSAIINVTDKKHLRKCCITEKEMKTAVLQCHIREDGTHFGVEKTTEFVQCKYYWVGISRTVRSVLRSCQHCVQRNGLPINYRPTSSYRISESNNGRAENIIISSPVEEVSIIKTEQSYDGQPDNPSEILALDPDIFYVSQETVGYFWQKVELQVFGPYTAGKNSLFVAVALDCYSQFPEAAVLESTTAASVTAFVLNLVCRYGVMEKLCLLQNSSTRNSILQICLQDLQTADICPACIMLPVNPADERWVRISRSLDQFITNYPTIWDKCLEAFLLPLRISLPPLADYAPFYLAYNREPMLPEKISHKSENICNSEVSLTEENERETVDVVMSVYGKLSRSSNQISLVVSNVPVMKTEEQLPGFPEVLNLSQSTFVPLRVHSKEPEQKRTRGRPRKQKPETVLTKVSDESNDRSDDDVDYELQDHLGLDIDPTDKAFNPRTRHSLATRASSRKRKLTYKAKAELRIKKENQSTSSPPPCIEEIDEDLADITFVPTPFKRRRGRPRKTDAQSDLNAICREDSSVPHLTENGQINTLETLCLDVYYLVIKHYKEHNTYPPRVSPDLKRTIRRLAESVEIRDGRLYGASGKSKNRIIVSKEKQRFSLMRKAHIRGEIHIGRDQALKALMDQNVFWKGMSLDIAAFIYSCPECVCKNPNRNKTCVRIPSVSKVLTKKDHKNKDFHISEDEEEGESSYKDVTHYLVDSTFPTMSTEKQQSCIREQSKDFCIIDGSLFYQPSMKENTSARKVLFSSKSRQEAIQKAHIENGAHLSQQDTQAVLRKQYFWSGMTYDVLIYVASCSCMEEPMKRMPLEHRNPAIWQRVLRFRKFYTEGIKDVFTDFEKNIECSQTSQVENSSEQSGEINAEIIAEQSSGDESTLLAATMRGDSCATKNTESSSASDCNKIMEAEVIAKALENAIVQLGGEKSLEAEKFKPKNNVSNAKAMAASEEKKTADIKPVRKHKTKHKCDHCDRVIIGDTAFRIHLYKHTGIKPFFCSVCAKSFTNRKSQRIHMRKHSGFRPFLCNQCGRDFYRSTSLRYHLLAHSKGETIPVSCDVCGRTFSTQHRLARHKLFKHPAQDPVYMCNQCGKRFTAARSLKRHEQTHLGIKNYQCEFCTKAFYRKEYLTAHLVSHPEYDSQLEKLKPRKKPGPKPKAKITAEPESEEKTRTRTVILETGSRRVATMVLPVPSEDSPSSSAAQWTGGDQSMVVNIDSFQTNTQPAAVIRSSSAASLASHFVPVSTGTVAVAHSNRGLSLLNNCMRPITLTLSAQSQQMTEIMPTVASETHLQHGSDAVRYEVECDLNTFHFMVQQQLQNS